LLGKPVKFCVINLLLFFVSLTLFGFSASLWVMAAVMVFIVLYNTPRAGFVNAIVLAIIYGLIFDSDVFSLTYYKFRLWYFLLLLVVYYRVITYLRNRDILHRKVSREQMVVSGCVICLFLLSAVYFLLDPFIFKFHNIKYWLFYVCLIIVLYGFFKDFSCRRVELFDYLISIAAFVAIWGIIQFVFNLRRVPNYMYDYSNIRPSAFFSETTWYAEYLVFGLFLVLLRVSISHSYQLLILTPFFISGIVLSATRNAYIGLLIFVVFSVVYVLLRQKVAIGLIFNRYVLVAVVVILTTALVFKGYTITYINHILYKFTLSDPSAQGRMKAFEISIKDFSSSPVFGQGFGWGQAGKGTGVAVGAKSFNLFFMILHIFGVIGFIPFAFLIILFYIRTIYGCLIKQSLFARYSLIMFTTFLAMSMFAPIHQYSFGMYVVAMAVYLSTLGLKCQN
jgi:hypothetical protein